MSERTAGSRFARARAVARALRSRANSRVWSCRISRWRERLVCFRAEAVRADSESSRRESWPRRDSRFQSKNEMGKGGKGGGGGFTRERMSWMLLSVFCSESVGARVTLAVEEENCE